MTPVQIFWTIVAIIVFFWILRWFFHEEPKRYIDQDTKAQVFARDGARCRKCGATSDLHIDHIRAWSKGGDNSLDNLRVLCKRCNLKKGNRDFF